MIDYFPSREYRYSHIKCELTELKLYLCLEVTEQNINLECTVTEVLTFYCIPHDFVSCYFA